ncbi:S41 family peptidase [Oceanicaulis sp. LC35]|uniref:S41 family peptidase n=1 Tax=Oceanicaulis sp. LC35 TaxID=3349635 RepID=UPI003F84DECA
MILRSLFAGLLASVLLPACQAQDLIPIEDALADAHVLYTGLQEAHYDLFAATPKPVYDQYYRELQNELVSAPRSLSQLHLAFQRFAAHAHFAHTRIEGLNPGFFEYLADENAGLFPLSFEVREGEVIITQAPADFPVRPGDRIVSLNGAANSDWLTRLTRNIPAETAPFAYAQMEGSEAYFFWLEYGAPDQFTVGIETADGQMHELELPAITYDALMNREGLARHDLSGREARMLTDEIAYLRPGPFYDTEAQSAEAAYLPEAVAAFSDFVDASFETFIEAGAYALILDLRNNPGGSNAFSDLVMSWIADRPFRFTSDFRIRISEQSIASNQARIDAAQGGDAGMSQTLADLYDGVPMGETVSFEIEYVHPRAGQRFEGRVYALVNRQSYSNAVVMGATIQDYGFGDVIGEATTDMATTYGAMEQFTLPRTGLVVGYPKALIIRPSGDERAAPLTPDVRLPAPQPGDEGDSVLDAAIAHVERALR